MLVIALQPSGFNERNGARHNILFQALPAHAQSKLSIHSSLWHNKHESTTCITAATAADATTLALDAEATDRTTQKLASYLFSVVLPSLLVGWVVGWLPDLIENRYNKHHTQHEAQP